jgi:HK97 family phage portal protein
MNLIQYLRSRPRAERGLVALHTTMGGSPIDPLPHEYLGYVHGAYKANGPVFAVILARLLLFAEARPRFRGLSDSRLFGTPALSLLERPWPHGTCRDLLARMEQDASLAGNAYIYRALPDRLQRLQPDQVDIVVDQNTGEKSGFLYWQGGRGSGSPPVSLALEDVAHYCPIPDPTHPWRGMSWLTPVVTEIESDKQQTRHKQKFFENAATPNLLVTVERKIKDQDARETFRNEIDRRYGGLENAYRTLILDDGADAKVIGQSFEQITFAAVQAAGENRIASAGGVPAIVVGLKEGLQAATYSNYAQAMRRFAEMTMHPLWGFVFGDLATVVKVPDGAELWYDASQIPALQQDAKDAAEILNMKANVAGALIRAGYQPDKVGPAIGLPNIPHTGKVPVTLYPEGNNPAKTGPQQAPEDQAAGQP